MSKIPFKQLLDELYVQLQIAKSPVLDFMNSGIDRVVVQSKFNAINVEPPAEVYELYEWKNGLKEEIMNGGKTIGEMRLFTSAIFPNFNFSYQAHINFSSAGYWEKSHFPIFCSGVGDY